MHYLVHRGFVDGLPRRRTTTDYITIALVRGDGESLGKPWVIVRDAAIPSGFVAAAVDAGVGADEEAVRAKVGEAAGAVLETFSTNADEDREFMAGGGAKQAAGWLKTAVAFRIRVKAILEALSSADPAKPRKRKASAGDPVLAGGEAGLSSMYELRIAVE